MDTQNKHRNLIPTERMSIRDLLSIGNTPKTQENDYVSEESDTEQYFVEEGTYAHANEMNGYEMSSEGEYTDDMCDVVSSASSLDDPDEAIAREEASRKLFEEYTKVDAHTNRENLNFKSSTNTELSYYHSSANMQHYTQTYFQGYAQNDGVNYDHGKAYQTHSQAYEQTDIPSILTPSLNRVNSMISHYLAKPTGKFVLKDMLLNELPEIMKTMTDIKHLEITQCELKNLINLPPNLETLDIKCNNIVSITTVDLPRTLTSLNANKNRIRYLDLTQAFNIKKLNLSNNPLTTVVGFPPNVEDMSLAGTDFCDDKVLSVLQNLQNLSLNTSAINCIDNLPDTIVSLSLSKMVMFGGPDKRPGFIQRLPKHLMKFVCHSSGIKEFGFTKFPEGLSYLDLYDNELTTLPEVPNTMTYIDVSMNNLQRVANVPTIIENYDCTKNSRLKFTPEQTVIINELKKNQLNTINTCDDDTSDDWMNFLPDDPENRITENTRATVSGQNFGSTLNTDNTDYHNQTITFGSRTHGPNTNPSIGHNSMIDRRGVTEPTYGVYQDNVRSTNTETRTHMGNYFANMRHRGGFGNFGARSQFESRFGPGTDTGPSHGTQPNGPALPPHVRRLMGSDGFVPTKLNERRIKHAHIYLV